MRHTHLHVETAKAKGRSRCQASLAAGRSVGRTTAAVALQLIFAASSLAQPDQGSMECGATVTGNTGAADNVNVAGNDSPDHVYTFSVPSDSDAQAARFSTCPANGGSATFDTVLRIFRAGSDGRPDGEELANNDDACGRQSTVVATLPPGRYVVVVDGFGESSSGEYTMVYGVTAGVCPRDSPPSCWSAESRQVTRQHCNPAYCNARFIDGNGGLRVPSEWTSVPYAAFMYCDALTSIDFAGSAVTSIAGYAFYRCEALASVGFADSAVTSIGEFGFYSAGTLASVNFTRSAVNSIGTSAFGYCDSLRVATFAGSNVTSIGIQAFETCTSLTSLNFTGSHVQSIGNGTFSSCLRLVSVTFVGASVRSIGHKVFFFCQRLTSVLFGSDHNLAVYAAHGTNPDQFAEHGCRHLSGFSATRFFGPPESPGGVCKCEPVINGATCNLEFSLSAAGLVQRGEMQVQVNAMFNGQRFNTGASRIVPGFNVSATNLTDLFENAAKDVNGRDIILFVVESDYIANSDQYNRPSSASLGDDLFVTSSSGKMSLHMDYPGTHTVSLFAHTSRDVEEYTRPVMVLSWTVQVDVPGTFGLRTDFEAADKTCGRQHIDELQQRITDDMIRLAPNDRHDVNTVVTVPGINTTLCSFSEIFSHAATNEDGASQVSFGVAVEGWDTHATASLGDYPFYTDEGRVSLALEQEGRFRVKLQAFSPRLDGLGLQGPLYLTEMLLDVRLPDTHGQTCSGHGEVAEDEDRDGAPLVQNDKYRCICNDSWTGNDCETPPPLASASASTKDTGITVGAILGAVVVLMLAALIAFRIQVYRLRHRPIDVSDMQADVMRGLGLAATTNIGISEFGITLVFAETPGEVTVQFKAELDMMLRKAVPQIRQVLPRAKITAPTGGTSSKQVLVVMQKVKAAASIAETVVEQLLRKAGKSRLAVGRRTVVDAMVAVPQRVPREIPRSVLTRIQVLGQGAFGVVHQYQLEEKGSAMSYFVAAKSIKASAAGAEEARSDLMREATLGALLAHRNVVATIGICTAPRDVPALLLLAFCLEGNLEALCQTATPESMTVSERLTFCAQVLQGLRYISTRRIVHRDVAARNVLLDSTMTSKVSDFGMATALQEDGKEYIRSDQHLALRWCSIEVITEGKYSVQSDIWAFGVLAYEVFACGKLPYAAQFDNLTEISSFVKEGGKLGQPNAASCPHEVYEGLMLPCFATNPTDRPSFGVLYAVAVKHGAQEDEVALTERAERHKEARALKGRPQSWENGGDRSMLGVSVDHLHSSCVPAVLAAIQTIQKGDSHKYQKSFDDLPSPADASIWLSVESFGKPFSATTVCPVDGEMGSAYVNVEAIQASIRHATAFLSYAWGYKLAEVVETLVDWCSGEDGNGVTGTWIWMDCFTLNQHRIDLGNAATPEELQEVFGVRVTGIGHMVVMLDPWDNPGYVKRAWCLFELYTAIQSRDEVHIDVVLSPTQAQAFRDRINRDGSDAGAIDGALASVKSEAATATMPADLEAIQALIQKTAGGNATIDGVVKQFLRRWFVAQGGVAVMAQLRCRSDVTQISSSTDTIANRSVERIPRQAASEVVNNEDLDTNTAEDSGNRDGIGFASGELKTNTASRGDNRDESDAVFRVDSPTLRGVTVGDRDTLMFAPGRSAGADAHNGAKQYEAFGFKL